MKLSHFLLLNASFATVVLSPIVRADVVPSNLILAKGSTATAPALTAHPNVRDDFNSATTIDATFFTYGFFIKGAASAFPNYNFVFASLQPGSQPFAPPIGMSVSPVDPSDFTVSQYNPWVVDSNKTTNNVIDPSGANVNSVVTGQDAGGANIVISYAPKNCCDPTNVNFVQAYVEDINGIPSQPTMDSTPRSPYYNKDGISGTGNKRVNTVPLATDSNTPAWMVDTPFVCENGPIPELGSTNCYAGKDETITSANERFETFIEADQTCSDPACGPNLGKTYQVLYGGVDWGFNYFNADPEPSYTVLLACLFTGGWLWRTWHNHRRAALAIRLTRQPRCAAGIIVCLDNNGTVQIDPSDSLFSTEWS